MSTRTVLIIDGDDTLWENNVYFEQAIEDFIDFLAHSTLSREQVRATLDEIERFNSGVHGYGSAAFARNLRETYERLAERAIETRHLEHVMNLGRRIVQVELDLLPDVAPTLEYLAARHRLLLFTKGEPEEQRLSPTIWHRAALRPGRRHQRKRHRGLPNAHPRTRGGHWPGMDGWKFSALRYQPGAGGRPGRRVHSASAHLAIGARGCPE